LIFYSKDGLITREQRPPYEAHALELQIYDEGEMNGAD
jgi:hypothetical protein